MAHSTAPAPLAASSLPKHQHDERNSISNREFADFEKLLSNSQNSRQIKHRDIYVDWERNSLTFEDRGDPAEFCEPYGYCDLRVRALEIDQIIPPQTQDETGDTDAVRQTGSTGTPSPRNPGGAPRKFADDLFIEIVRIANGIDGLPENKSDLIRHLREYNDPSWGENIPSEKAPPVGSGAPNGSSWACLGSVDSWPNVPIMFLW